MKYIVSDRITAEIDKIIDGLKEDCNPNPLGTAKECLAAAEIEVLKLVKDTIDEMKQEELWRKGSEHPNNKHPYPVINPDTLEMAFAYYDLGWRFDRNYNPGINMLWLDIEKILPFTKK